MEHSGFISYLKGTDTVAAYYTTVSNNEVIAIKDAQTTCQTLLHEALHGICEHYKLDIKNDEDTIDKLANGLYMVIADNPEMFEVHNDSTAAT